MKEVLNKGICFFILFLLFTGLFPLKLQGGNEWSILKGPYLGQKPPGMTPELFAPGIISTDASEGSSGFLNKASVFLFQRIIDRKSHTYILRQENNRWTDPVLIPFWEQMVHNGDFTISPDEKTMIYQVKKESNGRLDSNIWKVEFQNGEWGPCLEFSPPINTPYDESFASESRNGNLYFFSRRPGGVGKSDLYVCYFTNGQYSDPINLKELNTPHHEWDPFIAPDESYLIFCSTKPGGMGQDDLYISFRNHENQWCEPIHLDNGFNSSRSDNRPYVTRDGLYFFFTSTQRGNRDIYWVDAKIIENVKPEELNPSKARE